MWRRLLYQFLILAIGLFVGFSVGRGTAPQPSKGQSVSLTAAKQLSINKGKSDDEVRKDIQSHGYTVTD